MEKKAIQVIQQDLFVADNYYETSNELEIPDLQFDMQAQSCQRPFLLWGEQKRTFKMDGQGVLHFYTDDYRYGDKLFQHPENI